MIPLLQQRLLVMLKVRNNNAIIILCVPTFKIDHHGVNAEVDSPDRDDSFVAGVDKSIDQILDEGFDIHSMQ